MPTRLLAVLAACAAVSSQAFASDTPVAGGAGGNSFRITCDAGSYLVGLTGRDGAWVNQIRPVCAPWQFAERRFGTAVTGSAAGDSTGGWEVYRQCPLGEYVIVSLQVAMTVNRDDHAQFVARIHLNCRTAHAPWDTRELTIGRAGYDNAWVNGAKDLVQPTYERPRADLVCPQGEVAVGIQGRAGLFVDALGLICAATPGVKTGVDQARVTADRPWQAAGRVGTALGAPTCNAGFIPRKAAPNDDICVTPESHERVLRENSSAQSRRDPKGGPYGPNTCLAGFVWRGAFNGDVVCVTPEARDMVRRENEAASGRAVGPTTLMRR